MKFLTMFVVLSTVLGANVARAAEPPPGHWYSSWTDPKTNRLVTYENWYTDEKDADGVKVVGTRIVETAVTSEPPAKPTTPPYSPPEQPISSEDLTGPWYCYANDFINGHAPNDRRLDSCIRFYYKGVGGCKDEAMGLALMECQKRSENRETCEIVRSKNCFKDKDLFWNNHKK